MASNGNDTQQFCTYDVVIGIIILVILGLTRNSNNTTGHGFCGAAAKQATARSAKRSFETNPKPKTEEFASLEQDWMNTNDDESKNPSKDEFKQDEAALLQNFDWNPGEHEQEVNDSFDAVAVDKKKAMLSANIRSANLSIAAQQPTFSKRLGMANPMLDIYKMASDKAQEPMKFASEGTSFLTTEAYHSARAQQQSL